VYVPITSGSFEAKISTDIQQTCFLFCNIIEDKIFATDFLRFFSESFQKNVKSRVFLKSEKNEKYVFSNTGGRIQGLPKFFEYPLLSQERVKLQTSNLAGTFTRFIRTKVH